MNSSRSILAALCLTLTQLDLDAQTVRYVPQDAPSIQAALNASSSGDVIRVSPGVYYESALVFSGLDVRLESVLGPEVTVIDAESQERIAYFAVGSTSTLAGFTLRNGRAPDGADGADGVDGYLDGPILHFPTVGDPGSVGGSGGAIFAKDSDVLVERCLFQVNRAGDGGAGGRGGNGIDEELTGPFPNSSISGDDGGHGARGGDGGAVHLESGSLALIQCAFVSNEAGNGGEGGAGGSGGSADPDTLGCDQPGKDGGDGGNAGFGGNGGALSVASGTLSVVQCVLHDNRAGDPGSPGTGGAGGAGTSKLFCSVPGGAPGAPGATASMGAAGAIWTTGTGSVDVLGSIERESAQLASLTPFQGNVDLAYSNFNFGGFPLGGVGNIQSNPKFVSPFTGDFRLQSSSPCIDAADSATVVAQWGLVLDLHGNPRFHDDPGTADTGTVGPAGEPPLDMGVFEFGAGPLPAYPDVFVDWLNGEAAAWGTFDQPYDDISWGTIIAQGGTVGIAGGTYAETLLDVPATLTSTGGVVRIE